MATTPLTTPLTTPMTTPLPPTIHTRVLLLGNKSVGKTAYTRFFTKIAEDKLACPPDHFDPYRFDNKRYTLEFIEAVDTATIVDQQFDCTIVFFSVADLDSFDCAIKNITELSTYQKPFILCGTHVDCKHRVVTQKHINKVLKEYHRTNSISIKYTNISNLSGYQYYKPVLCLLSDLYITHTSNNYYFEPAVNDTNYSEFDCSP